MMVEEIRIFGVYMPAGLAWAAIAAIVTFLIRGRLHRLPLSSILWYPALVELAIFVILWWAIAWITDAYFPRWLIS
jgi:hypothetical protein